MFTRLRVLTFSFVVFSFANCATTGEISTTPNLTDARGYKKPVYLEIGFADGTSQMISSMGEKPLIVFLFTTYDELSQFTLQSFVSFTQNQKNTDVMGIVLQPDAKSILQYWVPAFNPPFPVGFDSSNTILNGTSDLGPIDTVPMTVFLNEERLIQKHHFGFLSEDQMTAICNKYF